MTEQNIMPVAAAAAASMFVRSLGVNTHIDFSWSAYNDLASVQNALAFLGVQNVRDAIDNPADLAKFAALNQDIGVRFDFFIAPGDAGMPWQLGQIESDPAIVRFVEGPNESDNFPQTYDGLGGLAATAAEQQALFTSVKATLPGVPVIAPSFGQLGSYGLAGDLAASADDANAHIYFGTGNAPGDQGWIQTLLGDAGLVAPARPVITTETGYYTSADPTDPNGVSLVTQAKYVLDDIMDQFNAGVTMDYLYELVDEQPDPGDTDPQLHFGLFNNDWTPKPAATAIHNLLNLLQDPSATGFVPGSLSYKLTNMPVTGHSLLLEKSDGTFALALWNDARLSGPLVNADITVPAVPVTLSFLEPQARITVFDPLTGTAAIQSAANANQLVLGVPDHPILIEIGPGASAGGGLLATAAAPLPGSPPDAPPMPVPSPASPTGITVSVPSAVAVTAGQTVALTGVSIGDPWAAGNLGGMTLNLSATGGTLTLSDDGGNLVAGSGSAAISLDGNLFQLNTDLTHLTFTAGTAGNGVVIVDVWDPAGIEATSTIAMGISADSASPAAAEDFVTVPVAAITATSAAGSLLFLAGGESVPPVPDSTVGASHYPVAWDIGGLLGSPGWNGAAVRTPDFPAIAQGEPGALIRGNRPFANLSLAAASHVPESPPFHITTTWL